MKFKDITINKKILFILSGLAVLSTIISIFYLFIINSTATQKITKYNESIRPAELKLIIVKNENCKECANLNSIIDFIKSQNIKIVAENTVNSASDNGQILIKDYKITNLPTLLVTGELNKNDNLKQVWAKAGDIIQNTFVLRQVQAPYEEVSTGKIRGLVSLTLVGDSKCTNCYDVNQHKQVLANGFGISPVSSTLVDAYGKLGSKIVSDYKITQVPTFVLSGDVSAYPNLVSIWDKIGSVEKDGSYVFRDVKQMGKYADI